MPRIPSPPRAPGVREADVLADIRLALGQEPDLVLWRLSQGAGVLVPTRTLETLRATLQRAAERRDWMLVDEVLAKLDELDRFTRGGMVVGAADLIGILRAEAFVRNTYNFPVPHALGRFFALEVKRPAAPGRRAGKPSPEQDQWLAIVRRMGGFAAIVDSVDAARAALSRARQGTVG
jgi:hypothetical protein